MALCNKVEQQEDDNSRWGVLWMPGKLQQYPPPAALPDYINRALPPRPGSGSSPICDSYNEGTQLQLTPKHQLLVIKNQGDLNTNLTGASQETELATVQPLQILTPATPRSEQQTEIVCPQPKYSTRVVLEASEADDFVSPISAPLSGSHHHPQYEVSPVSAGESTHSIDSALSESNRASGISHDSSIHGEMGFLRSRRGHRLYGINHMARWSRDITAKRPPSPQYQVEQINLRYSDPGSPISGAVIHPPSSFPSDPNLRFSRRMDENEQTLPESRDANACSQAHPDTTLNRAATTSTTGSSKVAFAGTIDGFSTRSRANSKRTAGPPPPLKLCERPLVDKYVKTPFPPGVPEQQDEPRTRVSRKKQNATEREVKGDQGDKDTATKKLSRASSMHKFAFPKSLMRRPSQKVGETRASEHGNRDESVRQERRASPVPRVRNILSKAKQFGWGHGFKIGAGSEEARKEKRREEMKRQIRVGDIRS
ncbi:hypothetical protein GGS26DRAFT_539498 [Hypomontagnella submonticulosa]|nr:hypothetical protein GGS26DRAFT_539498 [Hypomontagnella submonticulosa]